MGRDKTKYKIYFKNENREKSGVAKGRVPAITLEYLLNKKLISNTELTEFQKNEFGRTFCPSYGDIEFNQPPATLLKRFHEISIDNISYYVCNQWGIDCLPAFNRYINDTFGQHILIVKDK